MGPATSISPSDDISPDYLRERTLSGLLYTFDNEGVERVEEFLAEAILVVSSFLADHGKRLDDLPEIEYDPWKSGVSYDPRPFSEEPEVLTIGGPRGLLQGGYQVLSERDFLSQMSLLNVLSKGLLHSYNQSLVEAHFGALEDPSSERSILYDRYGRLDPAVDEGVTQLFGLYVDADVTDAGLRREFVDAWAEWFGEMGDLDVALFERVAHTVSERIGDAEGIPRDRIVHGLAIQEPLIRDGDLSVLHPRPDRAV